LTWAFFVAGSPTQIASQWSVNDISTARLMSHFYANLKNKRGKGDSLRAAALQLMRNPQTRHPFYWASFILIGDWK
jgi:CHAT domain-containing protein